MCLVHPHWFPSCSQSHIFFLFSLVLGFYTHFPGLGFLHGICMTGWVDATHIALTQSWYEVFFVCACALLTASSTLNTLSLCLYIFFIVVCLSVCLLCYRLSYFVFTSSGLPDLLSLPPLPFPVSTLWLRHFRWHPQTYSGFLTQSGHDPKWPTAQ